MEEINDKEKKRQIRKGKHIYIYSLEKSYSCLCNLAILHCECKTLSSQVIKSRKSQQQKTNLNSYKKKTQKKSDGNNKTITVRTQR